MGKKDAEKVRWVFARLGGGVTIEGEEKEGRERDIGIRFRDIC